MGKGYNNYMCKKPFHPGSKANIKRAWMAEQKTENEKKKQEELKTQYDKEQDLYNNRALLSTESKDKLELNFMYEAPPGAKRERQKEDDEPEYKFEWQRKYNAPREDYAKGNADIKDQPFGIPVRNVRCIKCHKWGHINTDKECPLYSQASTSAMPTTSMDPMELMRQMREDGYGLKENVLGHHLNPKAANQQLLSSEESDPEMEFLKSLTTAEKKKLLRKLKKLSKKNEKSTNYKKKKYRKSKKSKHSSDSECGGKKKCKKSKKTANNSDSDSSSTESELKSKKKEHKKLSGGKAKKFVSRSQSKSSISSESESEEETHSSNKKKIKKKKSENSECETKDTSRKYNEKPHSRSSEKKNNYEKSEKESLKAHTKSCTLSTKHEKIYREKEKCNSKTDSEQSSQEKHTKSFKKDKDDNEVKSKSKVSSKDHQSEKEKHNEDKDETKNKKRKFDDSISESEQNNKKKNNVSDSEASVHECLKDTKNKKYDHPDGFSHSNPQAVVESNYLKAAKEYEGIFDDKFRTYYRDTRSPSVKQKYKK